MSTSEYMPDLSSDTLFKVITSPVTGSIPLTESTTLLNITIEGL